MPYNVQQEKETRGLKKKEKPRVGTVLANESKEAENDQFYSSKANGVAMKNTPASIPRVGNTTGSARVQTNPTPDAPHPLSHGGTPQ